VSARPFDLVVRGGRVVDRDRDEAADVGVVDGRVAAVGPGLEGRRVVDATGMLVIPGAVDGHVHIRTERDQDAYDDTFATGSVAAAFGGVTTFLDQVQVEPGRGLTLAAAVDARLAEAEGQCVVDYGFHVNPREPRRDLLAEIPELARSGFPSFKFFMNYEGYALPDDALLFGMQQVARAGGLAIVHAENKAVIEELTRQNDDAGRTGLAWYGSARPSVMEGEATHRALALAHVAGCRVLLFHVTSAEGVTEIARAKERGQQAFGEAVLHYLVLDESLLEDPEVGAAFELSPPLRTEEHRTAQWEGLRAGVLDVVSTDHGPRRLVRDARGRLVPPRGTSGIEVRLALVHELGVRAGRISLQRWVDVCCTRPAEVFGLPGKGRIAPGCDADIVVFDPEREVTISHTLLHSNVDHSTWEGVTVRGWPVTTIVRGEVVVADGELLGAPGHGRLAPRGRAPGPLG
jgi:dihydropyrimidinase